MTIAVHDLQEKISKFLREEIARKEMRMCVKIELLFTPQQMRADSIKTWSREDEADAPYFATLDYVDRMAADIVEICEERTDSAPSFSGGVASVFKLRTFQHGGGRASYSFKIMPSSDGGDNAGMADDMPASATGVLALEMRNNQMLMKVTKDMMSGTIGTLLQQLSDMLEENKQLRTERTQLVAEINLNKAAESERELAVVRQAHSEQRKDLFVGKAVSLLPLAASRLLEKTTGSGDAALPAIMSELGSSLLADPKRMAAIAGALTVAERALLGEAMRLSKANETKTDAAGKPDVKPDGASAPPNGVHT